MSFQTVFTVTDPFIVRIDADAGGGVIAIDGEFRGEDNASLTFDGPTTVDGNIQASGNAIRFFGPSSVADGVTLSGASVRFNDVLSLNGPSTGSLDIVGDFVLAAGATFEVTLAGTDRHDRVSVSGGNIELGGAELVGILETTVKEGDEFILIENLSRGEVLGQFSIGESVKIDEVRFDVDYRGDVRLIHPLPPVDTAIVGANLISNTLPDPKFDPERTVIKTETRTQFSETDLTSVQREALAELGIYARDMQSDELVEFLQTGRWLMVDLPPPSAGLDLFNVPIMRMNHHLVIETLEMAEDLYWESVLDPDTQQPIVDPRTNEHVLHKRSGHIRNVLSQAVRLYRSEVNRTVDPYEFGQFLANDSRVEQAYVYTGQLKSLVGHLDLFGLTDHELDGAIGKLLKEVLPKRMTILQLEGVIRQPEPVAQGAGPWEPMNQSLEPSALREKGKHDKL